MTDQSTPSDGKDVGYARAADDANLAREVQMLVNAGVPAHRVHTDLGHTGDTSRPGLDAALDSLEPGDRLVITRPDRLTRDSAQWEAVKDRLDAAGASLSTPGTPRGSVDLMMTVATGMADAERAAYARRAAARKGGVPSTGTDQSGQ